MTSLLAFFVIKLKYAGNNDKKVFKSKDTVMPSPLTQSTQANDHALLDRIKKKKDLIMWNAFKKQASTILRIGTKLVLLNLNHVDETELII